MNLTQKKHEKRRIVLTKDGSHTIFAPELDEHYHSFHGAINESVHVFINAGLKFIKKKEIKIFEIGFGTGLNALLTLIESRNYKNIHYTSIELFPLNIETIEQLNYPALLGLNEDLKHKFLLMHKQKWNTELIISDTFSLHKINLDLREFKEPVSADIIYFDAFAPNKQPELWTTDIFLKMHSVLVNNGILTTYSSKGEVKRILKNIGFQVETLPGPPGKREMIRAVK